MVWGWSAWADKPQPALDVPYEPTPQAVVEAMLDLGGVTGDDVVYDLGCGDGRILVAAAKGRGARGVGVDLDPERIKEARENAAAAGVSGRVELKLGDIRQVEISAATIVTMYLLPEINLMTRPKLFRELRPGARCVSHAFDMGDWPPDKTVRHPRAREGVIYLWVIPARVGGVWEWTSAPAPGRAESGAEYRMNLSLGQAFQKVAGRLSRAGDPQGESVEITEASLMGPHLSFSVSHRIGAAQGDVRFRGRLEGDAIQGTESWRPRMAGAGAPPAWERPWSARRVPVELRGGWVLSTESEEGCEGVLTLSGPARGRSKAVSGAGLGGVEPSCALKGAYKGRREKEAVALDDLYVFGASVLFAVTQGDRKIVFCGTFHGDRGAGTVSSEGWDRRIMWTARRQR